MPRTSMSGTVASDTTRHHGEKSWKAPVDPRPRPRAWRHLHVPSSSWMALWRTPRRSELTLRVGLCSMVRARISSKLSKPSGPFTKALIAADFSAVTPGVMSTSTMRWTRSGAWSYRASVEKPPSDMPTTARAEGRQPAYGRRQVRRSMFEVQC